MISPDSSPTLDRVAAKQRSRVKEAAEAFEHGSPLLGGGASRQHEVEQDLNSLKEKRRVTLESLRVESAGLSSDGGTSTPPLGTPRPLSAQRSVPTTPTTPRTTNASTTSNQQLLTPDSFLAQQLAAMSLADRGDTEKENRNARLRLSVEKGKGRAFDLAETTPTRGSSETVLALPQVSPSKNGSNGNGAAKTLRPAQSKDDLQLLVCSAGLTELSMSIQECNTIIFEIQELRHSTAPAPNRTPDLQSPTSSSASVSSGTFSPPTEYPQSSPSVAPSDGFSAGDTVSDGESSREGGQISSSALSQVDAALIKLHAKMDSVRQDFTDLESRLSPFFSTEPAEEELKNQIAFLQRKWVATASEWESTQKDADVLGDELNEDKWITVFRTVSSQAEEMMRSLEKVLKQCHEFIWDLNRRQGEKSSDPPRTPGGRSLGPSAPSNPKKLAVGGADLQKYLSTFIALHRSLHSKVKYYAPACERVLKILGKGISDRSTKNGEVLRRYGEMKTRWRNLLERITRIEGEMGGVEGILRDAGAEGLEEKNSSSLLTPPKAGKEAGEGGKPGRASPFRRLANKFGGSSTPPNGNSSPVSSPSTSPTRKPATTVGKSRPPITSSSSIPSDLRSASSSSTSAISPPRPPKSNRRVTSGAAGEGPPPTLSKSTRGPPPNSSHRYTQSANLNSLFPTASTPGTSNRIPHRSVSPAPSADGGLNSKPRWNISTKREPQETLRESTVGTSRSSIDGQHDPSRNITPGRHSVMGLRSSSRMSGTLGRSINGARPISPAYSNYSDGSSAFVRDRPNTPSKIPMPSSIPRQRSTTPFSSLEDPEPTSILQRAMSPSSTSLNSSQLLSVSPTTGRSRLPTPRAMSPTPSNSSMYYNRGGPTPEPNLIAQAQKMRNIRMPNSRPPPVPSIPLNMRDTTATPRAGARRPSYGHLSSRPPSALSNRTDGVMSPTMFSQPADPQPYSPNHLDPLDVAVSSVVNNLPLLLHVERLDPPITRSAIVQDSGQSARYFLSLSAYDQKRSAMLKLVDQLGPRATKGAKKVLVRVGGGWQDLESYCMGILATSLQ